jgi:molecular chaperone GrpE
MTEPNITPDKATPAPAGANGVGSEGEAAAGVLKDLEALRARAAAAEAERARFLDLAQRTQADFENYQKRIQRDLAQERRYAQLPLALDLLPALDNLERATAEARKANETGPLVQGVAMVQAQLLDVLRRHGVTRIEALGKPFDPNLHEAVMKQPAADQPAGTVLQVLEPGYKIHERVLRPARVVVSAAPGDGHGQG